MREIEKDSVEALGRSVRTHDSLDVAIGRRLRARRKLLGLSQKALADRLGISFQQVQKYELGVNRMAGSTLLRVGEALGITAGALVDGPAADAPVPEQNRETWQVAQMFESLTSDAERQAVIDLLRALTRR